MYNSQRTSEKQKVLKPDDFMDFGGSGKVSKTAEPKPDLERQKSKALFQQMDAYASRMGINNAGEQEARERIAREKAEASGVGLASVPDSRE